MSVKFSAMYNVSYILKSTMTVYTTLHLKPLIDLSVGAIFLSFRCEIISWNGTNHLPTFLEQFRVSSLHSILLMYDTKLTKQDLWFVTMYAVNYFPVCLFASPIGSIHLFSNQHDMHSKMNMNTNPFVNCASLWAEEYSFPSSNQNSFVVFSLYDAIYRIIFKWRMRAV